MKYYVNPSFSFERIDEGKLIVVCNDYLREYECEVEILKDVLEIVRASGELEDVYGRYESEYTREEIEEFLTVLIQEAVQSRASVHEADVEEYASLDMEYLISARDGLYSLFYFQQKDIVPIGNRKDISQIKNMSFETVDQSIEYVISRIKAVQLDADILFVDLTREGIGIPVVKVLITKGTQLMGEPLLVASERLFEFQRKMGYSDKRQEYTELYLAPYPH